MKNLKTYENHLNDDEAPSWAHDSILHFDDFVKKEVMEKRDRKMEKIKLKKSKNISVPI